MKGMIARGFAVAVFSALMTVGGTASAVPNTPCTAALEGAQTTTPVGTGFLVWECHNGAWMFVVQYVCDNRGVCEPL